MTNEEKVVEALTQKMQGLKKPQQEEEKTVENLLYEFIEGTPDEKNPNKKNGGLKYIDFPVLNATRETTQEIVFEGEETKTEGKIVTEKDSVILSALAVSKLAEKHSLRVRVIDGGTYVYTGTHYEPVEGDMLHRWLIMCKDAIGAPFCMRHPKNIEYYEKGFRNECLTLSEWRGKTSKQAINVANGVITFDEKGNVTKTQHTHELPYRYCLKYKYDKDAKADEFNRFLNEVLPDEQAREFLQTYIGSIFTVKASGKIAFLFGDGANGKSVFLNVIEALLDSNSVTHYKISLLCDGERGKDARKGIEGKTVNICTEAGKNFDSNYFKNMADGEPIDGNYKYQNSKDITDYARLIFACNELPRTDDRTHGFFRKIAIVRFGVTIPEEKQDKELEQRIKKNELSGVLNWVIEGVQKFIRNKYHLPKYEEGERLLEELKLQSDNVLLFLHHNDIQAGSEPVPYRNLYEEYEQFVRDGGYGKASERTFSDRLRNKAKIKVEKAGSHHTTYAYINRPL